MSVLQSVKTRQVLYRIKGKVYEDPPSKNFVILHEVIEGDTKYIEIKRSLPLYIHICLIFIFLIIIGVINAYCSVGNSMVNGFTIKVPTEMYYDSRSSTIDVDIPNDSSNNEVISILLKTKDGNEILKLNGIEPGYSIGSIPVSYKFDTLPSECYITYSILFPTGLVESKNVNVLIVDRAIADKDENRDF